MNPRQMLVRGAVALSWAVLAAGLLGAALPRKNPVRSPARGPIAFGSPAGFRPAGPLGGANPFAAILPSGRIVDPAGESTVVGTNVAGLALTTTGKFVIVGSADNRPGRGDRLSVVDTRTMRTVDAVPLSSGSLFGSIVACADPLLRGRTLVLAAGGPSGRVWVFDLSGRGKIAPDKQAGVALPAPLDLTRAAFGHAYPSELLLAAGGRQVYAVDRLGNDVATIDLATRTVTGPPAVTGFFPAGIARAGDRLLISDEGLMSYSVLATPASSPEFAPARFEAERSSALTLLPLGAGNVPDGATAESLPMDPAPDGTRAVGGAHPTSLVATPNGAFAFVAMTNVDRIATVALDGTPRVVGGTELRLYDRGPYGTQPVALALSRDGRRLYVALAGIDAVAVLDAHDPQRVHRLGLIPTGREPRTLALSNDGKTLFVANGIGIDNRVHSGATLERIDLTRTILRDATRRALANQHAVRPARPSAIVPQVLGSQRSTALAHVVTIFTGTATYDALFGDLGAAAHGDPALVEYGEDVTPNLHALARTFALAANFFTDAPTPDLGHAVALAGTPSAYAQRMRFVDDGTRPLSRTSVDPEDYPRAGYLFDALSARGLTYRDYGDLLSVAGFAPSNVKDAAQGLGGRFTLDVPALAALRDHVDVRYPAWNPRVDDATRAREFERDFAAARSADGFDFVDVWLPTAADPGAAPRADAVADADRALGSVVQFLTHQPAWDSTAIFVVPDDVTASRDHVDPHRAFALVISPYARRQFAGMRHVSPVSVLKTEEEILGLPALSLDDALASDMSDFFTPASDPAPYTAVGNGTGSSE